MDNQAVDGHPGDLNMLLVDASSRYGAPMGRPTVVDDFAATVVLFRVRMVDGVYDQGGAYWGKGTQPLYAAIGDGCQIFLRASCWEDARQQLQQQYPELTINGQADSLPGLDDMLAGYVAAALFAEIDDDGIALDDRYGPADVRPAALAKMRADCLAFMRQAGNLLVLDYWQATHTESLLEYVGHHFWLTRNHHGTGFWDGDWKEPAATRLTELSHTFGEQHLIADGDQLDVL